MSPFLESIGASAVYGVLHTTIKSLFSGNSDEITKRLYDAVDQAADRFHDAYGDRFGGPRCSFLARHDNLKVIAKSLHYSQPPLRHSDFSPKGFEGARDATEDEINAFLQMLP